MHYTEEDVKALAYAIYKARLKFPGLGDPNDSEGIWRSAENQLKLRARREDDSNNQD